MDPIVVMLPLASTSRMPRAPSAMNSSPSGLTHTPCGPPSAAAVAGPPSPHAAFAPLQAWPEPATVLIVPEGSIRRTRCRVGSAMYSDPSRPTASPAGDPNSAWVAGPPSPQGCVELEQRWLWLPATTCGGPPPPTSLTVASVSPTS